MYIYDYDLTTGHYTGHCLCGIINLLGIANCLLCVRPLSFSFDTCLFTLTNSDELDQQLGYCGSAANYKH